MRPLPIEEKGSGTNRQIPFEANLLLLGVADYPSYAINARAWFLRLCKKRLRFF